VGWQHTEAAKHADAASVRAHALTVEASEIRAKSQDLQQIALTLFAQERDQLARARSVRQARLFTDQGSAATTLGGGRWNALADSTDDKLGKLAAERALPDSPAVGDVTEKPYRPAADALFPARFQARGERAATEKLALRDATNERNVEWDKRGNRYVAALAMLGTALYLFGFSLSRHVKDVRGYFLGTGFALLLIAGGWALINILVPVRSYPDRAAEHFARGHALLVSATGPKGYQRAESHFDEAIELRPTFVGAYEERQDATWQGATPQRATFSSLTTSNALEDAIDDLETARYLGAESSAVTSTLGFAKVLLGLRTGDSELMEESVELGEEALREDESNAVAHSNLAVANLALGRIPEAREGYAEAARRRPDDLALASGWLSGTLTDLDLVGSHRRALRDEVRRFKQGIMGLVQTGSWTQQSGRRFKGVAVHANPAYLQVDFTGYDGYDGLATSIHWYQRTRLGWTHLESVSDFTWTAIRDGTYSQLVPYLGLTVPPTCLPDTRFRVELYVAGRLAGTARGESRSGAERMEPFLDPDSNLRGCHPEGWRQVTAEGVARGWVSPDRTRGVYVLRLNDLFPEAALTLKDEAALRRVIPALADAFPGAPSPAPRERYTSAFLGGELFAPSPAGAPPEKQRESIRVYRYPGGRIIAGARVDLDGTISVGLVYGDDAVAYRDHPVFESLSRPGL
jgi:tetratricopeptide (TPR) repeat protein